jgi:acetyltransferase-like isoleucine patch superfamily enzyme
MLELPRKLFEHVRLYMLRRRQFDSLALRALFRERHRIDVGLYSYGCFDRWRMPGPIVVGRYCSIASTVRSAPLNHPLDALTTHPAIYEAGFGVIPNDLLSNPVLEIEDDVWIGHNVVILPGCRHIGRGAVIGAGSIVTRNVEAYGVYAGNPARKLRARFDPELQAAIEQSRWWEMDLAALRDQIRRDPDGVYRPSVEGLMALSGRNSGRD